MENVVWKRFCHKSSLVIPLNNKNVMWAHSTSSAFHQATFRFLLSFQRVNEPVALKVSVAIVTSAVFKQHRVSPKPASEVFRNKKSPSFTSSFSASVDVWWYAFRRLASTPPHPTPGCVKANHQVKLLFTELSAGLPQVSDNTPSQVLFLLDPLGASL